MIGFAIVAGAYVLSNFGEPRTNSSLTKIESATADAAPMRVFIPTADTDIDGVEDWRDQFITAPAVNLTQDNSAYEPPKDLTGQLGVSLIEGLLATKAAGPIAKTKDQLLDKTLTELEKIAISDTIYDYKDIVITNDTSDEVIRTYGNAIASIIITQSKPELKHEIILLRDYLVPPKGVVGDPTDLISLATVYKNYRDYTLKTPVPRIFIKQHLDLINVYNALYVNIDTMSKATEDPVLPYVRLKRYEDDVAGLGMSLENMYSAILPYAKVFKQNDAAILLVDYSGEMQ